MVAYGIHLEVTAYHAVQKDIRADVVNETQQEDGISILLDL
jgi:hypothetical protein